MKVAMAIASTAGLAVLIFVLWPTSPISTTVCALRNSPAEFSGRIVLVRARIESNNFEWFLIVDDSCARLGVNADYSDRFGRTLTAKNIDGEISSIRGGTDFVDISGTFIGQFNWHPREIDHHVIYTFRIDDIKALTIHARKTKRLSPFPEFR